MKKIFILAIAIRLICLYLFRYVTNYDLQSYLQVGELTSKGINIYPEIANLHHPYLPFFLYVEAIAIQIGHIELLRLIGPIGIIKVALIMFDLGILYLVFLLSKKNLKTTFLYSINPVTILITTLHGQFDVIPIFFILITIYLLNKEQNLLAVLSYSFAILTKTWPILLIVAIERIIRNKKLLFFMIIFPVLFVLIYIFLFKSNIYDIGKTIISYQGLYGIWGPLILLGKQRILIQKFLTLIFLISFFIFSYFNNEKNLIKNILNLLFFFFIFTTNFSIQYFVWIVPFLILIKPKGYQYLIILINIYLLTFYCSWLFFMQNIVGFILWFSFIKIGYLSSKKY